MILIWKSKNSCYWLEVYFLISYKWSCSKRSFDVAQRCGDQPWKNNVVLTFSNAAQINVEYTMSTFDVVQRCKFKIWHTERCLNIGLTLSDVATPYLSNNNVETTLKSSLGRVLNTPLPGHYWASRSLQGPVIWEN